MTLSKGFDATKPRSDVTSTSVPQNMPDITAIQRSDEAQLYSLFDFS